ncbi:hypothetical protein [Minwuia sp.]|uniref:hypothetical protein n=1 Tax=Minwuia sp. TaxID=2493630 RepID=UPI003A90EA43
MTQTPRFRKPALKTSVAAVAWFNAAAESNGTRLQPRKLQHLLYMAQGLFAAANDGRALMPSRFIAGSLGPCDPNLYPVLEVADESHRPKEIDPKAEACLSLIFRKFGTLPVEQLEGFVEADGIFADVRELAPDAEIPLDQMGPAYRRAFMGDAEPCRPAPAPRKAAPAAQPQDQAPVPAHRQSDDLPEGVPKVITGGKPVKRWAPKRRVY